MYYCISGTGALPPTFVSPHIAAHVMEGSGTAKAFLEKTASAPAESLDDVCAVCLMPLTGNQAERNTECVHIFHRKCIKALLSHSNKCPMCRTEWCCSNEDLSFAEDIRASIDLRERRFEFRLYSATEYYDDEELRQSLHNAVCVVAFSSQQHDARYFDWEWEYRNCEFILANMRTAAVEASNGIREAAQSRRGHEAISSVLRCLRRITIKDMNEAVDGYERDGLKPLISRLMQETAEDANDPNVGVDGYFRQFILDVIARALEIAMLYPVVYRPESEERPDIFDDVDDDENVLALFDA